MSKRGRKPGRLFHAWEKILVYKDDIQGFQSFELDEEQRLKIPLKTMKRKYKKRTVSSKRVKKLMDKYEVKYQKKRQRNEKKGNDSISTRKNKTQTDEATTTAQTIDQIFDKYSFDNIFDTLDLNGGFFNF